MSTISNSQKIAPCLWFDQNAEAAVDFYLSVFKKSKKLSTSYYTEAGPLPAGTVLAITFRIEGVEFTALNGGPVFQFSEAISFYIYCRTQKEIDYYWEKLSKGGSRQQCGWVKDKFGVSWQVAPANIYKLITGKDRERTNRVMSAMLKMKKIDVRKLEDAYHGSPSR
jgi:predicted 3-demethylubiquinone-9 3-methyltransferase (glyoxalase superfamily)